jgi:hypothetical protein
MALKNDDVIMQNKVFAWLGLGIGLILLIPLIAMQFTNEVNWDVKDFIVMGFLLFTTATLFVLVSRRVPRRRRVVVGFTVVAVFVYVWAELAVGIFTN